MAYVDEVLAETGLVNYWRMGDAASPLQDQTANNDDIAITGATLDVAGALLPGEDDGAVSFDGTNDFGQVALTTLAGQGTITVEFWLFWDSASPADRIALEFTADYNGNFGGFLVLLNSSGDGGAHSFGSGSTAPVRVRGTFPQSDAPAGGWNHWVLVFAGQTLTAYINGQPVVVTVQETGSGQNFSSNDTLNVMARNGSGLPTAGDMDELALYVGELSAARVLAHYEAGLGAASFADLAATLTGVGSLAAALSGFADLAALLAGTGGGQVALTTGEPADPTRAIAFVVRTAAEDLPSELGQARIVSEQRTTRPTFTNRETRVQP